MIDAFLCWVASSFSHLSCRLFSYALPRAPIHAQIGQKSLSCNTCSVRFGFAYCCVEAGSAHNKDALMCTVHGCFLHFRSLRFGLHASLHFLTTMPGEVTLRTCNIFHVSSAVVERKQYHGLNAHGHVALCPLRPTVSRVGLFLLTISGVQEPKKRAKNWARDNDQDRPVVREFLLLFVAFVLKRTP